jgi:hypothetical protein
VTVAKVWDGTQWVSIVGAQGPAGPQGAVGPTGATGPPTAYVGTDPPASPPYIVWVDTDEPDVAAGTAIGVFHAYNNDGNFTITANGVWQKIKLNFDEIDTHGWFDATTNWRYTPLKAGYYQLDAFAMLTDPLNSGDQMYLGIYKNGLLHRRLARIEPASADGVGGGGGTVVAANGTTDYFEFWMNISSSGSPTRRIWSGDGCWMGGYYVGT